MAGPARALITILPVAPWAQSSKHPPSTLQVLGYIILTFKCWYHKEHTRTQTRTLSYDLPPHPAGLGTLGPPGGNLHFESLLGVGQTSFTHIEHFKTSSF